MQSNIIPECIDFSRQWFGCRGIERFFQTVWANDICEKKAKVFCANHDKGIFYLGSIENIRGDEIPNAFYHGKLSMPGPFARGNMEDYLVHEADLSGSGCG